jgi:hypothetical protein
MKTKVKTYNGCNIYVHNDGTFYCDPINNSDEYKNAGIKSEKLSSVEKAIDNYETNGKTFVNKYIVIVPYNEKITVVTSKSKLGNRIFFDDGTMSDRRHDLKYFYNESVTENEIYKNEILPVFEKLKENAALIKTLYDENVKLRKNAEDKMRLLDTEKAFK